MSYDSTRFQFLADALNGNGGFLDGGHLIKYPRESDDKFSRRKEIAWYANDLRPACERFVGYLAKRPPVRDLPHPLLTAFADECNWSNDSLDSFWSAFTVEAKARGSMLLLVDMPAELPASRGEQQQSRAFPYLVAIEPERVKKYLLNDRGQLRSVTITDTLQDDNGTLTLVDRTWDEQGWRVEGEEILSQGTHNLGVCPVLAFTETGLFPHVGNFSQIAYLSKRLYNLRSELDELLRSQTFSILAYHVPESKNWGAEQAKEVGETIGTHNMLIYYGSPPGFISPADTPTTAYMEAIARIESLIQRIALTVELPSQTESGVALTIRFQALNSTLVHFARRLEDFERKLWDLVCRWLQIENRTEINWSKDFAIADLAKEIEVAQNMEALGAPVEYKTEKLKQLIALDLSTVAPETLEDIQTAVDEGSKEPENPELMQIGGGP